jgi:hypothetical protein
MGSFYSINVVVALGMSAVEIEHRISNYFLFLKLLALPLPIMSPILSSYSPILSNVVTIGIRFLRLCDLPTLEEHYDYTH